MTMIARLIAAMQQNYAMENGTYATIAEIAAAEQVNESYLGRVLRLTLLAPDIVEAILHGRQPAGMTLAVLIKPFPVAWKDQEVCRPRRAANHHLDHLVGHAAGASQRRVMSSRLRIIRLPRRRAAETTRVHSIQLPLRPSG